VHFASPFVSAAGVGQRGPVVGHSGQTSVQCEDDRETEGRYSGKLMSAKGKRTLPKVVVTDDEEVR